MDENLIKFFQNLDRSLFIDNEYKSYAQHDGPLPIGFGQTISQPSLVAYMTEKLLLNDSATVLEIGTGSGYQTAFLAQFSKHVYSVEKIEELSVKAQKRLKSLGYTNISYKIGDGSEGWVEFAPFDRIMVTAAPKRLPTTLIDQLNINGHMIIPVGQSGAQQLLHIHRNENGIIEQNKLLAVSFVEMVGKYS